MANEEHVALLRQGVEVWNRWRDKNPDVGPDLRKADLSYMYLRLNKSSRTKLVVANRYRTTQISGANLSGTNLSGANLSGMDLSGVNLSEANLGMINLSWAVLKGANLSRTFLNWANLSWADLREANLSNAILDKTIFSNNDLSNVKGLDKCHHDGPSVIDHQTLQRSGSLPLSFLRGVGLPDNLIDYLPSLLNQPIQFFSCFISYSSKDQEFADRLHADLQNKGVRCWFAPHDMPIGAKIIDALDEAIRLRDKVLLILSEHSVASDWVEEEVTRALDEERSRRTTVLFPIRIDDAVLNTSEAWARGLRIQRHIGDFCLWKDHDAYQKVLERVLRDLKVAQAAP
jgi:uncharacterized protein YjbI with pentapeptide repeats